MIDVIVTSKDSTYVKYSWNTFQEKEEEDTKEMIIFSRYKLSEKFWTELPMTQS